MTRVINLYGGPGTGKSTSAALLFGMLKMAGENAELVREYVKEWAWEGRRPGEFDQLYFMGKQMRKESMLYGKVDWIVTDSPVMLGVYYARNFAPMAVADGVEMAVRSYYMQARKSSVEHNHVMLKRSKPYNPAGRYQTEAEAKAIDAELEDVLPIPSGELITCGTEPKDLIGLLYNCGLSNEQVTDLARRFNFQK
jgi:hypothetical protein